MPFTLWDIVLDMLEPVASRARRDPSRHLKTHCIKNTHTGIHCVRSTQARNGSAVVLICLSLLRTNAASIKDDNQGPGPAHASRLTNASCRLGLAF